jgi:DNA invertase Pin-like site-specific DNA recombinase
MFGSPGQEHELGYDGYIRVSQTKGRSGDSFISPDTQRTAIEKYAKSKGVEVVVNEPELDSTGSKLERPILDKIMARIRFGESEGIIVATVDRLSRAGLGDAISLVEKIRAAGGKVGFADLDIDTVTPEGEFALNIWLSLARMQWRNYQKTWANARERAIDRGVFVGPTPLGFDRLEDRTLVKNADAEHVRRTFDIVGIGDVGPQMALSYLRHTFPKRQWSVTILEKLLGNRIYIGEVRHGSFVKTFPELAIVDRLTFDLAQRERTVKRRTKLIPSFPLVGVATCAACGKGLGAQMYPDGRRYRCRTADCTARASVSADALDALVLDAVRADPPTATSSEAAHRFERLTAASQALDQHRATELPPDAPGWMVKGWKEGLREAEEELAIATAAASTTQIAPLPDLHGDLSYGDMRLVFNRAVAKAAVRKGRGPLVDRLELVLR